MATAPNDAGHEGQNLTILPKLLTRGEFMTSMPDIIMKNEAGFSWLPSRSRILDLSDAGNPHSKSNRYRLRKASRDSVCQCSLQRNLDCSRMGLSFGDGYWRFLWPVEETASVSRWSLRSLLGLRRGKRYPRITLVSYDGVRLRLAYGSPEIRVASIYLATLRSYTRLRRMSAVGR